MKFDNVDQKILEEMYHSWRITISDIARKTKLSRKQVDYRLEGYQRSGIIRSFFLALNYQKLGFPVISYAFVRVNGGTNISRLGKFFSESKRCTSWGIAWSRYDLLSNWLFKSKQEQDRFFRIVKSKFKTEILELAIVEAFHAEFYPLRVFNNGLKVSYELNPSKSLPEHLDPIDKSIITHLGSNARMPIVSLAKQVGISPELCVYRLRRLHTKQIILGSRVQFDLLKAGYYATCLFIDLKKPRVILPILKSLCSKLTSINYLIVSDKSPNVIIQVFHKDESTLRSVIKEIRGVLTKNINSIQVIQLDDDISVVNPVPFL